MEWAKRPRRALIVDDERKIVEILARYLMDEGFEVTSAFDGADAIELGHAKKNTVVERQRPARERGPRPPRHDLDALAMAVGQNGRDLFRSFRQYHHHGKLAVRG